MTPNSVSIPWVVAIRSGSADMLTTASKTGVKVSEQSDDRRDRIHDDESSRATSINTSFGLAERAAVGSVGDSGGSGGRVRNRRRY